MPTKEDVEQFLEELRGKLLINDNIIFRPRDKNTQGLLDLDISANARLEIIKRLTYEDCFSGPNKDNLIPPLPDYYEFGVVVKRKTAYIKLSLGHYGKKVVCMSFHEAEYPIKYPLKNN